MSLRADATGFESSPLARTVKAVGVVWRRDLRTWSRNKTRIVGAVAFPLTFLVVFGSGLSRTVGPLGATPSNGDAVDFQQFVFPGIIAMSVFIGAIFNAVSVVYDRNFGILREILVAPVSRAAISLGKALGGATVSTLQGVLVLLFAPLVGISLSVSLVLKLLVLMFLGAFSLSSMGIAIGARMQRSESFQMVNQLVTFPLVFLSGIFFPVGRLPRWMAILVHVNPVTYAVDPIRHTVLANQHLSPDALARLRDFGLGISIGAHQMTVGENVAVVLVFGLAATGLSMWLISIRD